MVITLCSSANFYQKLIDIQDQLELLGHTVLVPDTAAKMRTTGNFAVDQYKTWFKTPEDYHLKTALMDAHFKKVAEGDAILVLNYQKHGVDSYIGGNVLMEMTVAHYLKKPIYVLNELPADSGYIEELHGLNPTILNGNLKNL